MSLIPEVPVLAGAGTCQWWQREEELWKCGDQSERRGRGSKDRGALTELLGLQCLLQCYQFNPVRGRNFWIFSVVVRRIEEGGEDGGRGWTKRFVLFISNLDFLENIILTFC